MALTNFQQTYFPGILTSLPPLPGHTAPPVLPEQEGQKSALRPGSLPDSLQGEQGITGVDARFGWIFEDYNPEMQFMVNRMMQYQKLLYAEPAVQVMELVICLPNMAANWRIDPGDDADLSEAIDKNLLQPAGMRTDWTEFIREQALASLFGFSVHEKVFDEKPGGFLGLERLAERKRETIFQWIFSDLGQVRGVYQRGFRPSDMVIQSLAIPVEKLVVSSFRPDAGNPEGRGFLRAAWGPAQRKLFLEIAMMARIQRQGFGLPVMTPPDDGVAREEDKTEALEIMRRIVAGQSEGVFMPPGWKLTNFECGPADVPFIEGMEFEHQYILQCILAQFISYGQGHSRGTNALSKDASSMFIMCLEAIADWIRDTLNRQLIPQLCYLNVAKPGKLPRLEHGPIGIRDIGGVATAMRSVLGPNVELPPEWQQFFEVLMGMGQTPIDVMTRHREAAARRMSSVGKGVAAQGAQPALPGVGGDEGTADADVASGVPTSGD